MTVHGVHPTLNRSGDDASNSSQSREWSNTPGACALPKEVVPKITWLERYRATLRTLRPDLTDGEMESTVGTFDLYHALNGRFPTVPEQAAQFEALYYSDRN
jgi:hypothetical protein